MQDLSVFEAVVEIVQSLLLFPSYTTSSPLLIGVDIKAKKRLQNYDSDCQVFYIRVSSNQAFDLEVKFKENELKRFAELLLCMQCGEEEGHLSVQCPGPGDRQGCEQKVFWLEQEQNGDITLRCQHSEHVPIVGSAESLHTIHFRVIQKETHIVEEGHRIHRYLHKIKLLKEKVDLSFSMKVWGAVCQTDFSVKKYIPVQDIAIVDDIRHFFGKDCLRTIWCGAARAFVGHDTNVPKCDDQCGNSITPLTVSTLACFYPLVERYPQSSSSISVSGHVVINVYGPQYVALAVNKSHFSDIDVNTLVNWEQFSLKLKDTSAMIHGDLTLGATLTNLRYVPEWASDCTSFLLCIAVVVGDIEPTPNNAARNHDIINNLQGYPKSFSCVLKSAENSLSSCLGKIFVHRETEHEKLYRKTYLQNTEMITSSICDIFNHSTDSDFRSKMMRLLRAENKEALKKNFITKLRDIAKISECLDSSTGQGIIENWQKRRQTGYEENSDKFQTEVVPDTHPQEDDSYSLSQYMSSQQYTQQVDSTEDDHAVEDGDQELLEDIQELNNFDESIRRSDLSSSTSVSPAFHVGEDFEQLLTHTPVLGVIHDHLIEEEFFLDETQEQTNITFNAEADIEDGLEEPSAQGGQSASSQSQSSTAQGHLPATSVGDEWLDDIMLDMSDWI